MRANILTMVLLTTSLTSAISQKGKNESSTSTTTDQLAFMSASTTSGPYGTPVVIIIDNFPTAISSPLTVKFNGMNAVGSPEIIRDDFSKKVKFSTIVPKGAGTGQISVTVNNNTVNGPTFNYVKTIKEIITIFGIGSYNAEMPVGFCKDGLGNFYVTGTGNNQIVKCSIGSVTIFAGSGEAGDVDDIGLKAQFMAPTGICCDDKGNLYVTSNSRIRKITPLGVVSTITRKDSFGIADGNLTSAKFYDPAGICIDARNNLYVADFGRIRKITPTGEVSTLAGSTPGYADGTGTNARFGEIITGICVDEKGNVFVADLNNYRIRRITPTGNVSTIAGSGIKGTLDGTGTNAQFCEPTSICVDVQGNIYVGDRGNCGKGSCLLRMINAKAMVTTKTPNLGEFGGIGSLNALLNDPQGGILILNGTGSSNAVDADICKIIFE